MSKKTELHATLDATEESVSIPKPGKFSLDKFKTNQAHSIAGVGTLIGVLPLSSIAQAGDFVRLHSNENRYWSPELCFVNVPIKGARRDQLHLIDEEIAVRFLSSKKILRFRLALATKPYGVFFLCHVPSQNLDNSWNQSSLQACEQAKTRWVQVTSRREENVDSYKIDYAMDEDAFPAPEWPEQSLEDLIGVAFNGRAIETDDHPGLLRVTGRKVNV